MQRIEITHTTQYHYASPVNFLEHKLHLRPREGHDIRIEASELLISPAYHINWQRDVYSNSVAIVTFKEPGDSLNIISTVVVEQYDSGISTPELSEKASQFPFEYNPTEQIDLVPYQTPVFIEESPVFIEWLNKLRLSSTETDTMTFLNTMNQRIANNIHYLVRDEPGVQSPETTLSSANGSCRDMATLFMESCRQFGLASRFVSGYLVSTAAVEDVSTTHAWAEVYLPGAGWRGFDSTSGQLVGGDHIAVAVHRHPEAIPPVSGAFIGSAKPHPKMEVMVQVERL